MYKWMTAFFLLTLGRIDAQPSLAFRSLREVYSYADQHSYTLRNAGHETLLAKYEALAAKWNQWNLQGPASLSLTDNTKLSTTLIPAEVFGGLAGTSKPVTFGQKYVSSFTLTPQIDLFNPYTAALVKVAKTNQQLAAVNYLLGKKSLYESLAAAYYNILSYQRQIVVTRQSLANSDTLVIIVQDRVNQGLSRPQDLNTAQVNRLAMADKEQQLGVQLEQQLNSLKLLCDMPEAMVVTISDALVPDGKAAVLGADGNLLQRQSQLNAIAQQGRLNADKKWVFPTVNLFSSFGWQQNSDNHFLDAGSWYRASYIGLRLNIPLIPNAGKIATVRYDRVNLEIAKNDWQHNILQDSMNNRQAELDYQKAFNSYRLSTAAELLRKDTYLKNLNIYKEGILSATDLINSFNDWLNSSLSVISQLADSAYQRSIIMIINSIK